MNDSIDTLKSILFVLYGILATLISLAIFFIFAFHFSRRRTQALVLNEIAKGFQAMAQEFLSKGDYVSLRKLAQDRLAEYPGDASAEYFVGMACFRSRDLVEAKNHLTRAMKLDAQWRKLCTVNLEEIEVELKNRKPVLVECTAISVWQLISRDRSATPDHRRWCCGDAQRISMAILARPNTSLERTRGR